MPGDDAGSVFDFLDLSEYEESALETLLTMGRSTAPNLAEITGIPKARIYGVLEELANRGFVEITPSRPKEYQAKSPAALVDRAIENRRQSFESTRDALEDAREPFLEEYEPRYESASEATTPTEELFYVVDVGQPSERETRRLYDQAADGGYVITKSFEYFDAVRPSVESALERGVEVRVLFLDPAALGEDNRQIQAGIVEELDQAYPDLEYRFEGGPLPLRGTFRDPSMDYESGKAILLVEEKDIPLSMRQAAITENAPFVAGLKRFFDLLSAHDSASDR
jgi:sugar-specific transcriptional regulator TrmB